jgi:hypothetical protein
MVGTTNGRKKTKKRRRKKRRTNVFESNIGTESNERHAVG